jgi:hypothetical protein
METSYMKDAINATFENELKKRTKKGVFSSDKYIDEAELVHTIDNVKRYLNKYLEDNCANIGALHHVLNSGVYNKDWNRSAFKDAKELYKKFITEIAIDKYEKYKKRSACYIATMAYGSYEHPQVIQLRKFRDEILLKSFLGMSFVDFYYWFSPKLVKQLEGYKFMNALIRKLLDRFICLIAKK